MERPTCKTCPYCVCCSCEKTPGFSDPCYDKTEDQEASHDVFVCKRYPPAWVNEHGEYFFTQPTVDKWDWCGEHPDFPAYIASLKPADPASHHPAFLQEFIKRHPEIDLTT